jgi:hypothetical protein
MIRRLSIRDKDLNLVPLDLNWAQQEMMEVYDRQVADNKPVRIIVQKARQLGISTLTEGLLFCRSFVYEHSRSLVLAHELDSADALFQMTQMFWDTFPYLGGH